MPDIASHLRKLFRRQPARYAGRTAREWVCILFDWHRRPPADLRGELTLALADALAAHEHGRTATMLRAYAPADDLGPLLEQLLDAGKPLVVRLLATGVLGVTSPPTDEVVSRLIGVLDTDPHDWPRCAAARCLMEIGTIPALAGVVGGNGHSMDIRMDAANKLLELGPAAAAIAIPALIGLFRDRNSDWRSQGVATGALTAMGPAAFEAVLPFLTDKDPTRRGYALGIISVVDPAAAVPHLRHALAAADPGNRVQAAEALWRIARDPAGVPVLHALLADRDFLARTWAAKALFRIDGSPAAVRTLVDALGDRNPIHRFEALLHLKKLGPPAAAVGAISRLVGDRDTDVRKAAVDILGRSAANHH